MSCAVMFQPSFATEGLSLTSHSKSDFLSSNAMTSDSSSNLSHQYNVHCKSFYAANHSVNQSHGAQSSDRHSIQRPPCRTPSSKHSGSDDLPEKTFKKLCSNEREAVPSGGTHSSPSHSSSSNSSAPNTPPINESDVKYVSANCVVVTHYRGDAAAVVDEHFSRALASKTSKGGDGLPSKVTSPMALRSFPPSFYQPPSARHSMSFGVPLGHHNHSDLYEAYHGSIYSLQAAAGTDPWTAYSISPQAYAHRSMGHDMYHQAMASTSHHPCQYTPLGFQQSFSRIPSVPVPSQMNKSDVWGNRYYESFHGAGDPISSGIESPYSYHNMAGLEAAGMSQDCAKEFYWGL